MSNVKRHWFPQDEFRTDISYIESPAYAKLEAEAEALREERDLLWQTFFNLAEKLGIDPEVEKSAPGKPSDVFLRHIEALRARVVVLPDAKNELFCYSDWDAGKERGWNDCRDEVARLNGKAVSEGLLREVVSNIGARLDGLPDGMEDDVAAIDAELDRLVALLGEGKGVGDVLVRE